jgi:hypothetical protein
MNIDAYSDPLTGRSPRSKSDQASRGRTRARAREASTTISAPVASTASNCRSTRTKNGPCFSGEMSCMRTCTTLGPDARVAARIAPKSKSCVKTTWPLSDAHDNTAESDAHGSPTADQWTESQPCSAKTEHYVGDRFMSTRIFIRHQVERLTPQHATPHKLMPRAGPVVRGTDNRARSLRLIVQLPLIQQWRQP